MDEQSNFNVFIYLKKQKISHFWSILDSFYIHKQAMHFYNTNPTYWEQSESKSTKTDGNAEIQWCQSYRVSSKVQIPVTRLMLCMEQQF